MAAAEAEEPTHVECPLFERAGVAPRSRRPIPARPSLGRVGSTQEPREPSSIARVHESRCDASARSRVRATSLPTKTEWYALLAGESCPALNLRSKGCTAVCAH